jgi:hypothetical protein
LSFRGDSTNCAVFDYSTGTCLNRKFARGIISYRILNIAVRNPADFSEFLLLPIVFSPHVKAMNPNPARCFLVLLALLGTHAHAGVDYVIAISVDALRGDYLQTFVDTAPAEFDGFVRLRNRGASTYNARCDYNYSETVPNHLSMITSRPVLQPGGYPNTGFTGFTANFPGATDTVHVYATPASGTNSGPYKTSIFDLAHDRGLNTALLLSKPRLDIIKLSFPTKIDFSESEDGNTLARITGLTGRLANNTLHRFTFLHIVEPDTAGHASGWSTGAASAYRAAVKTTSGYVGMILTALEMNTALNGKVAIILTADHGGTGSSHTDATVQGNFTIPFFVSAPGIPGGSNAYSVFENRIEPLPAARPTFLAEGQPIHNADLGNLSGALLGLPQIPGSTVLPEFKKPIVVSSPAPGSYTVSWPIYLTGWTLESCDDLTVAPQVWTPITTGITDSATTRIYTMPSPAPDCRFFRLRRPM